MPKTETDPKAASKKLRGGNGKRKTRHKVTDRGHLVILMDESGSMAGNEESVVEGCNQFLHEFAKDDVTVTIAFFDQSAGEPTVRYRVKTQLIESAKQIVAKDYMPRGMTPLNDAINETIETVAKKAKEDEPVFMAIITDG